MEEKIWELHSFRKNLILISLISLLLLVFWWNIENINFLAFKLANVSDWKIYTLLFAWNIYTLWRYWQYLTISPIYKNNKFIFQQVLSLDESKKAYLSLPTWTSKIKLDKQWNILEYKTGNIWVIRLRDIIKSNNYIVSNRGENRKHLDKDYDSIVNFSEEIKKSDRINNYYSIIYNKQDIKESFIFQDKYFADRNLPIILWLFSIVCTSIKILSFICK